MKPDLRQPPSRCQLRPQDALAVRHSSRHRLFAKHRLARLDTGDGLLGMKGVRAGDQHCVDRGVGDQGSGVGIGACIAVGCHSLRASLINVHQRHHCRALSGVAEIAGVHRADHARADHAHL